MISSFLGSSSFFSIEGTYESSFFSCNLFLRLKRLGTNGLFYYLLGYSFVVRYIDGFYYAFYF